MWFFENHIVLSPGKCHYLIMNKDIGNKSIELVRITLHAEAEQIIDKDLRFRIHVKSIVKYLIES